MGRKFSVAVATIGFTALLTACGGGTSVVTRAVTATSTAKAINLTVAAPVDGATFPQGTAKISVRGTVLPSDAAVTVDGIPARVKNGVFTANAQLSSGSNTIDLEASAPGFSPASQSVSVTRNAPPKPKPKPPPPPPPTSTSTSSPPPTTTTAPSNPGGYPAAIENNFIGACENQAGATSSSCHCELQHIESNVSLSAFIAANNAVVQGGTIPPWLYQAAAACVGQ